MVLIGAIADPRSRKTTAEGIANLQVGLTVVGIDLSKAHIWALSYGVLRSRQDRTACGGIK